MLVGTKLKLLKLFFKSSPVAYKRVAASYQSIKYTSYFIRTSNFENCSMDVLLLCFPLTKPYNFSFAQPSNVLDTFRDSKPGRR